jgi:phosphoserine phosphatase
MNKVLVFDMDGTIADLYGVQDWLKDLRAENPRPYAIAEPMYNMETLGIILRYFRLLGWKIAITTWLAKGASEAYNEEVAKVKREWLDKYNFPTICSRLRYMVRIKTKRQKI